MIEEQDVLSAELGEAAAKVLALEAAITLQLKRYRGHVLAIAERRPELSCRDHESACRRDYFRGPRADLTEPVEMCSDFQILFRAHLQVAVSPATSVDVPGSRACLSELGQCAETDRETAALGGVSASVRTASAVSRVVSGGGSPYASAPPPACLLQPITTSTPPGGPTSMTTVTSLAPLESSMNSRKNGSS